ncbi:MAG: GTP cyclohydrolase I FolE2 [Gammaproteobacteria bacterium]|nr:GTP cyclohydrolase I FolE2 [Gammaproteobacteria bacterium]MYD81109.1 GTP cyclohydrolase I FolE2 [Gammaproteobacteria bacterium]
MPDVAMRVLKDEQDPLDWVGMSDIRLPMQFCDAEEVRSAPSIVQLYVNLKDPNAKGIHMSRLYVLLDEKAANRPLSPVSIAGFLQQMLDSHRDFSSHALVEFSLEQHLRRNALVSDHSGWNNYPVSVRGEHVNGSTHVDMRFIVHYSSTCPASAALARQSIQHQFDQDFGSVGTVSAIRVRHWLGTDQGIVATPHGQRSSASVVVRLKPELEAFPLTHLIDKVEGALATPVQTAVKRVDEQEFALLNGQNPMFCEDAGRRLKTCLNEESEVEDFLVRVEHFESLHAHNAVCMVTKGIKNGFKASP